MKFIDYRNENFEEAVVSLNRRAIPSQQFSSAVADIIAGVREHGDQALVDFTAKFDGVQLDKENLFISDRELEEAVAEVEESTKQAIEASRRNIDFFAQQSLRKDWSAENEQGVVVGERFDPIRRVGIYVPGGKAPLVSTALMTGAFAQAAGVPEIVAATPVGRDGKVNSALLYAVKAAGATEILKVGGAHAIAALALGTESVKSVDKVVGPGNSFVVEAKRQLVGAVAIDLLPGPSEILTLADDSANPTFIAADLLAQAEHGGDSDIVFVSVSEQLIVAVKDEIQSQLRDLSRKDIIGKVIEANTTIVLVESLKQGVEVCNCYAPEHLSLIVEDEDSLLPQINTSGAIYIGNDSAVAVGDFLAGPSHTLPTGGSAKSFSGLRADQFQRRTSIVKMDKESVRKSVAYVEEFAKVEGLDAHGRSVSIRLE